MEHIISLVGPIRASDLTWVESFVSPRVALFMPCGGACQYAIQPDHTHPGYMFILPFDNNTRMLLNGKTVTCPAGKLLALDPDVRIQSQQLTRRAGDGFPVQEHPGVVVEREDKHISGVGVIRLDGVLAGTAAGHKQRYSRRDKALDPGQIRSADRTDKGYDVFHKRALYPEKR